MTARHHRLGQADGGAFRILSEIDAATGLSTSRYPWGYAWPVSTPLRADQQAPGAPIQVLKASPELQITLPAAQPGWRTSFERRRALAAALLTPITVLLFLDAPLAGSVDHPVEWATLGLLGVLAATNWATFVPRRDGVRTVAATPCGAMAGLYPVLALMTLGGQPMTPFLTVFAVLLLAYGVSQRVLGAGACSA